MTLLNAQDKTKSMSPEERHRNLIQASNDYMAGKISYSEFREAERRYMTDYNAVTLELGRVSRVSRAMFNRLTAFIH
jgi:hypothetical protein